MCRTDQDPENVASHIALYQCTECKDIIWANEQWFTYVLSTGTKRIHRSCLGDILAARLADPE